MWMRHSERSLWLSLIFGLALLLGGLILWQMRPAGGTPESPAESVIPVPVNYPAPALTLQALDGQTHSLDDYTGQVVLVNMWATWCPPCKAEMPDLEAYYEAHQAEGFILLSVNDGESQSEVGAFVSDYGLTFPVLLDPHSLSEKAFKTINLPSSYVIDRTGTVRLAWKGAISRDVLEKYVTPLIKE